MALISRVKVTPVNRIRNYIVNMLLRDNVRIERADLVTLVATNLNVESAIVESILDSLITNQVLRQEE